jgi:hypothetical protein
MALNLLRPFPERDVQPLARAMMPCFPNGLQPVACRNVLLVEYRDEVFARLAADLSDVGLRIHRVLSTASAAEAQVHRPAELFVVNVDWPDGGGWLLAAKLRLLSAASRIWLYAPWPLPDAVAMAEYIGADGIIAYEGDLFRLSAAIVSRVSILPEPRVGARELSGTAS